MKMNTDEEEDDENYFDNTDEEDFENYFSKMAIYDIWKILNISPFGFLWVCVCVCGGQDPNIMRGTLYSEQRQIVMYLSTKTQIQ